MKTAAELIKEYLEKTKIKKTHFCKRCRISRSSLHKYLHGEPIHPHKAKNIEIGSLEEIKAEDLLRKI